MKILKFLKFLTLIISVEANCDTESFTAPTTFTG